MKKRTFIGKLATVLLFFLFGLCSTYAEVRLDRNQKVVVLPITPMKIESGITPETQATLPTLVYKPEAIAYHLNSVSIKAK